MYLTGVRYFCMRSMDSVSLPSCLRYGIDEPRVLEDKTGLSFVEELDLTPTYLVDELRGMEKAIFKKVFAGNMAKKMYRLFEFEKN